MRAHAEEAGRDPDALILVNSTPVGCTDDGDRPLAEDPDTLLKRFGVYRDHGVSHLHLGLNAATREGPWRPCAPWAS